MGAVSISTYNVQLMAIANYGDAKQLKNLYRNYHNLDELSENGDTVAASIYIDLKTALHCNYLTELQRVCIMKHLIEKSTLREVSEDINKSSSTIRGAINGGLKRIMKSLEEGKLYEGY